MSDPNGESGNPPGGDQGTSGNHPGGHGPPPGDRSGYGQPHNPGYGWQPYGPPAGSPQGGRGGSDEQTWAVLAHIGGILTGFIVPLVLYLLKKDESVYVNHHTREALNFQITLFFGYIAAWFITLITFTLLSFVLVIPWTLSLIFGIIAAVAGNKGEWYQYPLSLRLIK